MPFDGAWAKEQLSTDFGICPPASSALSDLRLLRDEVCDCVDRAFTHGSTSSQQLPAGALKESVNSEHREHVVGGFQLFSGVTTPVLAAQPLAVK
jgi:hypothetical protein